MEDKPILNSGTIQALAGLVVLVLGLCGYQVATMEVVDLLQLSVNAVLSVSALILGVRGLIGRLKANRNLTLGSFKL